MTNLTEVLSGGGQGRKIRRRKWGQNSYIVLRYDYDRGVYYFETAYGNRINLSANAILCEDWEIVL